MRPGSLLSRALALVLLAALPLAGYLFVVEPVIAAYRNADEAITQARRLLQGYRERGEQRAEFAELLAAEEERADTTTGYLEATDDALAAAELQDRVKVLVQDAGGELRSSQSLKAEAVEGSAVRRAAVKIRFQADIETLAAILYDLETGEPYLFIEGMSIREQRRRRRRRREQEPQGPPLLDVVVDLYGYVRAAPA